MSNQPNLTNPAYLRGLCEKHEIRPAKGFGQNFIINAGLPAKICAAAGVTPQTNVLEIGPGVGTLTAALAETAKKVVAVEADRRLLPVLDETLSACGNVHVQHGDILKTDIATLLALEFGGEEAMVCANLPYNITSPILTTLLEGRFHLSALTVMVQKEAAQRVTAAPGTRLCGAISYAVWYYAEPSYCFTVKPGSFFPPPKVESAVIHLRLKKDGFLQKQREENLFRLVRAAFGQRRKTLVNSVSAGLSLHKEQVAAAAAAANLPPMVRSEALTLEDYIALEQTLFAAAEELYK